MKKEEKLNLVLNSVVNAHREGKIRLAEQYADCVAYSLYHDPNAKDPLWSNSKSLITAIILAISSDSIRKGSTNELNMSSVANFLSDLGNNNDFNGNNALDLFFKKRDDKDSAKLLYVASKFEESTMKASIYSTAMDKLQAFMRVSSCN